MRQVSLPEFGTRGAEALESIPKSEIILLTRQNHPAYFLVPVTGDIAQQQQDLQLALAKASLRESSRRREESGTDEITDEEINPEISRIRAERRHLKAG